MLNFSLLADATDHAAATAIGVIQPAVDAPDLKWAGLIIGLPALTVSNSPNRRGRSPNKCRI